MSSVMISPKCQVAIPPAVQVKVQLVAVQNMHVITDGDRVPPLVGRGCCKK